MNDVWGILVLLMFLVGTGCAVWYQGRRRGQQDDLEKSKSDTEEAMRIRDRLRHDIDFANRVRARFRR